MRDWATIERDVEWLGMLIDARFRAHVEPDAATDLIAPPPPNLPEGEHGYAMIARTMAADPTDRMLLILALTPHVAPEVLDRFLLPNATIGRPFTEFGGLTDRPHAAFLPTVQTARFLVGFGDDKFGKAMAFAVAVGRCKLVRDRIIVLKRSDRRDPPTSAQLRIPDRALARLLAQG